MTLNCSIINNECAEHSNTITLINQHPALDLISEYINPDKTTDLNLHKIDVVFISIELDNGNGFELYNTIKRSTKALVIFLSNKTKYAFEAFELNAIDYLKKSFTKSRFNVAIEKVIKTHYYNTTFNTTEPDFIFIKSNLKSHKVYIEDIKWIEALGDYIKVVAVDNSYVVLSTMKAFEKKIETGNFLRIHKSYIVNLNKVSCFNSKNVEIGASELPLSRTKKAKLVDVFNQN